jgi:hypothetical protein
VLRSNSGLRLEWRGRHKLYMKSEGAHQVESGMTRARFLLLVCISLLSLAFASTTTIAGEVRTNTIANGPSQSQVSRPLMLAILMNRDRRGSPYANSHAHVGATGLVRCGNTVGTGQLVLRRNIIVTAAHVLYGSGGGECVFIPGMGSGEPIPIDTRSIRAGSRTPLSEAAANDWAVARLAAPVREATPYGLAPPTAQPGPVTLYAAGNGGPTQFSAEPCAARRYVNTGRGVRELHIDCNGGPGGSGGAIIGQNGGIAGIYIGYRSNHPDEAQPFSGNHYNFGITIEGPFRRALMSEAH